MTSAIEPASAFWEFIFVDTKMAATTHGDLRLPDSLNDAPGLQTAAAAGTTATAAVTAAATTAAASTAHHYHPPLAGPLRQYNTQVLQLEEQQVYERTPYVPTPDLSCLG